MHAKNPEFDVIYDQVGLGESKLDSTQFTHALEESADYEEPAMCSRNQKDQLPEIPLPRCNTYEVPVNSGIPSQIGGVTSSSNGKTQVRKELEASNVYETPVDADQKKKEAAAELNGLDTEYTPMASVWNYTQYKKT